MDKIESDFLSQVVYRTVQCFIFYINELESELKCHISIFAGDTKVGGKTFATADCESIQKELNHIV